MELHKLRYNLYDYLIQDKFNYEYTKANITLWTYAIYAIFSILAIIIIVDYQKIKLITIFFVFICGIFVYLSIRLKEKLNKIETNNYLNDYINHFKLFNGIFIDSYNNNKIPTVFSSNFDYDLNLLDIKSLQTLNLSPVFTDRKDNNYVVLSKETDIYYLNIIFIKNGSLYIRNAINAPSGTNINYYLVAGGGGGGINTITGGNGGGGGEYVTTTTTTIAVNTYSIEIGNGGRGATAATEATEATAATLGSDTKFKINGSQDTIYSAKGGLGATAGAGGNAGSAIGASPSQIGLGGSIDINNEMGGMGTSLNICDITYTVANGGNANKYDSGSIEKKNYYGSGGDGAKKGTTTGENGKNGLLFIKIPIGNTITNLPTYNYSGNDIIIASKDTDATSKRFESGAIFEPINNIDYITIYNYNIIDYDITKNEERNFIIVIDLLKSNKYPFVEILQNGFNLFKCRINLKEFEEKKNLSKKLRLINENLISYFKIKFIQTDYNAYAGKLQNVLFGTNNNYLSVFYSTIVIINKEIRFIDNISLNDIFSYNDEYIKNNNILKFIDIYEDSFRILKKYIFIKINKENEFHKFISDNYFNEKETIISNLSDEPNLPVKDVIIDISISYDSTDVTSATNPPNYLLIDIETLNSYFNKNRNTNHINYYSSEIYKKLLTYYNEKLELNLKNFDVLFNDNKKLLQKKVKEVVNEFLLFYNFTLATLAIILIIILHIFYIEYFKYI